MQTDGYMGFTYVSRRTGPSAASWIQDVLTRANQNWPGRIVTSMPIEINNCADGTTVRLHYYIKQGESPTDFAGVLQRYFEAFV